ncbi:MAG: hypothetical protein JWN44_2975 [Myxococcales bacterium]|nr:hypothetical protein [Myxococcales bacterium]
MLNIHLRRGRAQFEMLLTTTKAHEFSWLKLAPVVATTSFGLSATF